MKKYFGAILFVLLALLSCSDEYKAGKIAVFINQNLSDKLEAIENNDLDLYLSTFNSEDRPYLQERERVFKIYQKRSFDFFKYELKGVDFIDKNTVIADVEFSYIYETRKKMDLRLIYRRIDGHWLDSGLDLLTLERENYVIKYRREEPRLEDFTLYIEEAYDIASRRLSSNVFDEKLVFTLFMNREFARDRVSPDSQFTFTGKVDRHNNVYIHSTRDDLDSYTPMIAHELVHLIASLWSLA